MTTLSVRSYTFRVVVEPDSFGDGTPAFHAYVPALPSCRSWGYTIEEAIQNVEVAAKMLLDVMRERGEPIPHDVDVQDQPRITINLSPK